MSDATNTTTTTTSNSKPSRSRSSNSAQSPDAIIRAGFDARLAGQEQADGARGIIAYGVQVMIATLAETGKVKALSVLASGKNEARDRDVLKLLRTEMGIERTTDEVSKLNERDRYKHKAEAQALAKGYELAKVVEVVNARQVKHKAPLCEWNDTARAWNVPVGVVLSNDKRKAVSNTPMLNRMCLIRRAPYFIQLDSADGAAQARVSVTYDALLLSVGKKGTSRGKAKGNAPEQNAETLQAAAKSLHAHTLDGTALGVDGMEGTEAYRLCMWLANRFPQTMQLVLADVARGKVTRTDTSRAARVVNARKVAK